MSELAGGKRAGPEKEVELQPRKKGKKGNTRGKDAHDTVEASPSDFVKVIPYRKPAADDDVGPVIVLSKLDKAAGLFLSEDRLSVTGNKGFRSVRATHGFHAGTFYCEVAVQHLGATGHCRIGWATKKAEINAPIGYDQYGVSYRDIQGSKVHKALREDQYGEPYGETDTIGLYLHLPEGGRSLEARSAEIVRYKGMLYQVQEEQQEPQTLAGSVVAFTKNGQLQGVAFKDIPEGTYYPAASLFTLPEQEQGACVQFNFGPDFKFPPPLGHCALERPIGMLCLSLDPSSFDDGLEVSPIRLDDAWS
eukprot:gene1810-2143_t